MILNSVSPLASQQHNWEGIILMFYRWGNKWHKIWSKTQSDTATRIILRIINRQFKYLFNVGVARVWTQGLVHAKHAFYPCATHLAPNTYVEIY
jgi:hypothetical protein